MDFSQIDKELQMEFARKKVNAEKLASRNLTRAFANPIYKKLDKLERQLVLEISRCNARSSSHKNLKENLSTIRQEKSNVLKSLKMTENDLKPKYECKKCLDTGFVGGAKCQCYKDKRNKKIIETFGVLINEDCTFENFDTSICKSKTHAENLQKLSKILQKWAEKYPKNDKNNIVISGKTGVGKTYLTSCLANKFLANERSVCFVSAFDMNEAFLKYHTTFDKTKSSWLAPFVESDILFIDDLGAEPLLKNVTRNYLYLVLSEREMFHKPVVITTNFLPMDLLARYDERIYSRLCNKRYSYMCLLEGDDLRISK